MAVITRFQFTDICQYQSLDVRLDGPGMYAVTGPNGCGKTNMLRGLVFGLTGLVDGLWGGKQTLQRDGTATPGHVDVEFTHEKESYALRRWSVAGAKFQDYVKKADGTPVKTGTKAVDEFMEDVFGMPCRLMFQLCWGRQGELSQLLTGTPTMVSTLLAQIFDTKELDKLRDKIKNRLDTIAIIPSTCLQALDEATGNLNSLPSDESMDKAVEDAQKACDDASLALQSVRDKQSMSSDEKRRTLDERRAELERAEHFAASLRVNAANPEGMSDADIDGEVAELGQMAGDLNMKKHEMNVEIASQTPVLEDAKGQLTKLLVGNAEIRERLDVPAERCEVCGQAITDREAYRRCLCRSLTGFDAEEAYDTDCRLKHDRLMLRKNDAERRIRVAETTIRSVEEALAGIKARNAELTAAKRWNTLQKAEESVRNVRNSIATLEAMATDDEARAKELEARTAWQAAQNALAAAQAERTRVATARALHARQVEEWRKVVEQYRINKEAHEILRELHSVFAQNRAQARFLKGRIESLNDSLQEFVAMTGMPFSLRLDDEERLFRYRTAEGYEHPAAHLSGAQKAMSAVALQMALFRVMAPNMPLYLIDEPTEALDDENKAIMARMFDRMSRIMPKMGGTMLIVTRDDAVVANCSACIQAGAENNTGRRPAGEDKENAEEA